jgi:hypothetical protein
MSFVFILLSTPWRCCLNHTEQLVRNKCFLQLIQFDAETTKAPSVSGVSDSSPCFRHVLTKVYLHIAISRLIFISCVSLLRWRYRINGCSWRWSTVWHRRDPFLLKCKCTCGRNPVKFVVTNVGIRFLVVLLSKSTIKSTGEQISNRFFVREETRGKNIVLKWNIR